MTFRQTIAAIATPPGSGGIGLIRVSGPSSEDIARTLFRPLPPDGFHSHRLYHGKIIDPATGATLDEVLIALLKAPGSYTGEDTIEVSCHGGPLILRTVLEAIFKAGARPAERGEFTQRAFLNNRLDLVQAESVLDIITARTRPGLAAALSGLRGKLSEKFGEIRGGIMDILAEVEAAIDFPEDDGAGEMPDDLIARIGKLISMIESLAKTYRQGHICREGVSVVIAGRPNVGKSSLLNRLLGEKRAIVTPIPGTTRDFIEETADIGGIPVRLTDTAGLRLPRSAVEKAGIDLVWERLEMADAVIILLDGSAELTDEDRELLRKINSKPVLIVINKADLPQRIDEKSLPGLTAENKRHPVLISATRGDGMERLTAAIHDLFLTEPLEKSSDTMILHLHQKTALEKTAASLAHASQGMAAGHAPEIVALDIREALDELGAITGRTTPEDVLDRIFAKFCIGK